MSLRNRLVGFAVIVIVFTLLSGATGYAVAYKLVGSIHDNQVSTAALRNQMQADMMHDALRADVLAATLDAMQAGQPAMKEVLADYEEHAAIFVDSLKKNEQLALEAAVAQSIAAARPDVDKYIKLSRETIDAAYRDPAAAAVLMPRFLALYGTLEGEMAASSDLIEAAVSRAKAEAGDTAAASMNTIAALSVTAVLAVLALSAWITRSILRTLGAEPGAVKALVSAVEQGELYHQTTLRAGDGESIMATLAKMVSALGSTVADVRQATAAVAAASGDLRQGNHDLAARTELQASSLQETASSMEELTATVRQTAHSAGQASELAASAASAASDGRVVVAQVVEKMDAIKHSAQKVTEIISVIDGIAFQTNILALNAAVEAARAGEQGRGFAVVASEVRGLAQRSAEAARQIKGVIGESLDSVDDGAQLVGRAGRAMQEIVNSINEVATVMADIKSASAEQSVGIGHVNQAISKMDQVTQQNAALVQEAAASAEALRGQADSLARSVSVFKLQAA
jgi:methyl-accepting chemotaxis protein